MSSELQDSASEPLLDEAEPFDPLDNDIPVKPAEPGALKTLLRSKYVIVCALFSSLGGLIFGYGIPLPNTILISRPRHRLCDPHHAALQRTLPPDSTHERHAHLFPRTRRLLWKFNLFPPCRQIQSQAHDITRLRDIFMWWVTAGCVARIVGVVFGTRDRGMGGRDVELSCAVVHERDFPEGDPRKLTRPGAI
jgi:hypothetical protein